MKKIMYSIVFILVLILNFSGFIWYKYTQMYVQDSAITATTGIIWKKTLNLEEYKQVSNGNDLWGKYNRYTRSDRHDEAISVYCKQYCKTK